MTWRGGEKALTRIIEWCCVIAPVAFFLNDFGPESWQPAMSVTCSLSCLTLLQAFCVRVVVKRIAYGCEHPLGK